MRDLEKHRWQKAEIRLRKSLSREKVNPTARYLLSVVYFRGENPDFQLDTAYHYAVGALNDYNTLPLKDRDRLSRGGVDSLRLVAHRSRIDSAAFALAREENTESAYVHFLSRYPSAAQREMAIELRDEVAFQEAVEENSYEAFNRYITRYPDAKRGPEARARYHRLLYHERTKDGSLESYRTFLRENPDTPYRDEIMRNIFEITTADGTVESFLSFIYEHPEGEFARKAADIVFHLLAEDEVAEWPSAIITDSLLNLHELNRTYLVPFLKDDLFGFMDENGKVVIPARYTTISENYLCGAVTDEILIANDELVARNGSVVYQGTVTDIDDIGAGILKIKTGEVYKLIHKSGFLIADSIEQEKLVAQRFLAIKKRGAWSLHSLAGRMLTTREWEDISVIGDAIVLTRQGSRFIAVTTGLGKGPNGHQVALSESLEEIKPWPGGLVWARSGGYEGVLTGSMQSVVRFDKHTLTATSSGAVASVPNGVVVYNLEGRKSTVFDQVMPLPGRSMGVKKNKRWFLYDAREQKLYPRPYDTLRDEGPFVIATRGDSTYVHFARNVSRPFFRPGKILFIPGQDSTSFIAIQQSGRDHSIFDHSGRKLFTTAFDALEYAGNGLFVITRKDRKGLIDINGRFLLPVEYDAIGTARENVISVLKSRKFGAYHVTNGNLIKPQYDRNLIPYSSSSVVTFRDGNYGFIGWDNKPLGGFEFEEIRHWNDSLSLVKKGGLWNLYDLKEKKLVETNLRSVDLVRDSPEEKVAIVRKENSFGVINNQGRTILPITFSEIINLGTDSSPLYFTEKHVPEASIYIVIYYDHTGEMLRKEIYDDAADYDKIYCSDK